MPPVYAGHSQLTRPETESPMPDALPLAGRHALITGGGRGIGAAIAAELARLGADLTLLGRSDATLVATRNLLREEHERRVGVAVADVTDAASLERACATARARLGPIAI